MARRAKTIPVEPGEIIVTSTAEPELQAASFYSKSGGCGPHDGGPDQSVEMAVRYPAVMLRKAIEAARADGYVIQMPFRVEDLDRIVVSATAKAS